MKVLLIDDNVDSMGDAIASLKGSGLEVESISGISDLDTYLKKEEAFHLVILDWLLDGTDSTHARGCLGLLRESRFVPVIIYTEQKDMYEREADQTGFPASCIRPCGKDEVPQTDLGGMVTKWMEGFLAGKISGDWRKATRSSVEKVLYDLAAMDDAGIQAALTFMTKTETGESLDVDHALELLQRMSCRHVCSSTELRTSIAAALKTDKKPSEAGGKRIWQLHMYYSPGDDIVRPGDIVGMQIEDKTDGLCVVLTPACDLDQFNTVSLRLVRLATLPDIKKGNKPPAHLYPLLHIPTGPKEMANYCVNFHELFPVHNTTIPAELAKLKEKQPDRKTLPEIHMSYRHGYVDMAGRRVSLKRLVRLDDPYRSDLFQKFSSHASRIGTPDISS